ncbi:integrase, catalytic region, zinc finger, CCHC-type containing protein [Tanacetum coccineum]
MTRVCRNPAAARNQRTLTCYECGNPGHYKSDCPELKNQNHGNLAEGTRACGLVHALGGGEADQDHNNMEDDINDIQYAGSDTRPPMLDKTDFESWQQRIRLYCLGKDNGENIMKSITKGPFQMGTVSDMIHAGTEGAFQQGPVLARVFTDLSAEEK